MLQPGLMGAWLKIDPTLKGSLSPSEVEQVATQAGLPVTAGDVEGMVDPTSGQGKITYDKFLEFVKRQEVDDIVSGYE